MTNGCPARQAAENGAFAGIKFSDSGLASGPETPVRCVN
jgi:hypothetical protein